MFWVRLLKKLHFINAQAICGVTSPVSGTTDIGCSLSQESGSFTMPSFEPKPVYAMWLWLLNNPPDPHDHCINKSWKEPG